MGKEIMWEKQSIVYYDKDTETLDDNGNGDYRLRAVDGSGLNGSSILVTRKAGLPSNVPYMCVSVQIRISGDHGQSLTYARETELHEFERTRHENEFMADKRIGSVLMDPEGNWEKKIGPLVEGAKKYIEEYWPRYLEEYRSWLEGRRDAIEKELGRIS